MLRLSDLIADLQHLERAAQPAHAPLILDAFTRNTPFDSGSVYMRDGSGLRLAAKSNQCIAPDLLQIEIPSEPTTELLLPIEPRTIVVLPIRAHRETAGILALSSSKNIGDDDLQLARVAAAYLNALLTNQRLTHEMREGDFQLKSRLWELESLYDIGLSIAATLNLDELADEVLYRMISLMNARRAALFLREGDQFKLYRAFGDPPALDDSLIVQLISSPDAVTLEDGMLVMLPIKGNNATIGVLAAADRETREGVGRFEENEMRLLSLFANQVAIALENARLHRDALEKQAMQRELDLAATIQRDILPKAIPTIDGLPIAAFSKSAKQVGGDYHAFFERDGVVSMLVADVSGKSMPAALLVSALHAALQLLFAEDRELGDIATELNKHIHRWSAENKFVTLVMVSIDREQETIEYINAGHNPQYIFADGEMELLKSHGLPVGILPNSRYMTQRRRFPKGSFCVLYSDGITEAEDVGGEEFENARLEVVLRDQIDATPEVIRDRIAAAVDQFAAGAPQKDDQTIVVARFVS
ncbi:MAG TPA: SpoIIE family protein phosphatase [Thermoanaerobaculia bacterium]